MSMGNIRRRSAFKSFPLPGATAVDTRLGDIVAIKDALESIDTFLNTLEINKANIQDTYTKNEVDSLVGTGGTAGSAYMTGDIALSRVENRQEPDWLKCGYNKYLKSQYPDLANILGDIADTKICTSHTFNSSASIKACVYGNNKLVVLLNGSSLGYYFSEDGSFTQMFLPASVNWTSVVYANGRFVAIAANSTTAAYSDNGINWTQTTMPASVAWIQLAYGNSMFVAIANNSNVGAYSTDGITWTQMTMPSNNAWTAITFGNGKFLTTCSNSSVAAYSTNATMWNQKQLPVSGNWSTIVFDGTRFICPSSGSSVYLYSEDCNKWTSAVLPISATWYGSVYTDGVIMIAANNLPYVIVSYDGLTWEVRDMPLNIGLRYLSSAFGKIYCFGSNGGTIYKYSLYNYNRELEFVTPNNPVQGLIGYIKT